MRAYIIRRLLLIIPTLIILTILVFLSVRYIPGDIIDAMAAQMEFFQAVTIDREALERMLGLDVPVYVQYGRWIGVLPTPDWVTGESHFKGLLHGNLGHSMIRGREPVAELIMGRLPVTIELGVLAIVIGAVDSTASWHLLGDPPGYRRRLPGALNRHHRPGNSQLLAGNDGHDLPGNLVGLVATAEADSFHRRPAGKSRDVPHSQLDSGDSHGCKHHADDAYHDAGGAQAGLYQDRPGPRVSRRGSSF